MGACILNLGLRLGSLEAIKSQQFKTAFLRSGDISPEGTKKAGSEAAVESACPDWGGGAWGPLRSANGQRHA